MCFIIITLMINILAAEHFIVKRPISEFTFDGLNGILEITEFKIHDEIKEKDVLSRHLWIKIKAFEDEVITRSFRERESKRCELFPLRNLALYT